MPRPCTCDTGCTITPAGVAPFAPGTCPKCWSWHAVPHARKFHGGDPGECLKVVGKSAEVKPVAKPGKAARPLPCVHLGKPTGQTVACPSCRGTVQLKTFACSVHGACTLGKRVAGVPGCCKGCPDNPA